MTRSYPHLVFLGDAAVLARAMMKQPYGDRETFARQVVENATEAAIYTKENGRAHPQHGAGSIMAAAMMHDLASEPTLDNDDFCECMVFAIRVINAALAPRVWDDMTETWAAE